MDIQQRHIDAARDEARDAALRDADTFADWLGAQCMYGTVTTIRLHLSTGKLLSLIDAKLPTADLLYIGMDPGQPAAVRTMAMDAITERYLATRAEQIERAASARAGEIAADEAADMREAA